jgi:hypothetical protein
VQDVGLVAPLNLTEIVCSDEELGAKAHPPEGDALFKNGLLIVIEFVRPTLAMHVRP